jgi:hypothetical protein
MTSRVKAAAPSSNVLQQQFLYRHTSSSNNDRTIPSDDDDDDRVSATAGSTTSARGAGRRVAIDEEDGEEADEEQEDTVGPLCTCGQISSAVLMTVDNGDQQPPGTITKKQTTWLESSFVHLMTPRKGSLENNNHNNISINNSDKPCHLHKNQHQQHHGYLEQHQLLAQLLDAAHGEVDGVELCVDCIDRVAVALEADTQRLYSEIQCYHETIQSSQHRARSFQQQFTMTTTSSAQFVENDINNQHHPNLDDTEEAYQQEIRMLQSEVQSKLEELHQLQTLQKEQLEIANHLEEMDERIQYEQNTLELESIAFDNRREALTTTFTEIQLEVDKLSLVPLPKALFDLQVDPRGLRYPLINQLRLAFRPKGDVPSQEIQVAWSQATQLLLILGTLLEYPSLDWKLVPISDCSKLIYRKEIFNLSPGDCRSLMAWNALLDQVVKHSMSMTAAAASMHGGGIGGGPKTSSHHHHHHISYNHHQHNYQYHSRKDHHGSLLQPQMTTLPVHTSSCIPPPPPFLSSPTSIGDTELARLDRMDHFGWSQVIHRMASNLLWLSDRACELAATQVSGMAQCIV